MDSTSGIASGSASGSDSFHSITPDSEHDHVSCVGISPIISSFDGDDIIVSFDLESYFRVNNPDGTIRLRRMKGLSKYNKDIHNLTGSTILECKISGEEFSKLKYTQILGEIYGKISDVESLMNETNFKVSEGEIKGRKYVKKLDVSVRVESGKKEIMEEIINQAVGNGIELYMKILLHTGYVVFVDY